MCILWISLKIKKWSNQLKVVLQINKSHKLGKDIYISKNKLFLKQHNSNNLEWLAGFNQLFLIYLASLKVWLCNIHIEIKENIQNNLLTSETCNSTDSIMTTHEQKRKNSRIELSLHKIQWVVNVAYGMETCTSDINQILAFHKDLWN